jgi:hypothetical protein
VKEVVPEVTVLIVGIDREVVLTPTFRPNLSCENAGIESKTTNSITISFLMVLTFKFTLPLVKDYIFSENIIV